MDILTELERRLIDEALERIPEEQRRVPPGVSGLDRDYIWDPTTQTLITRNEAFRGGLRSMKRGPVRSPADRLKDREIAQDIRDGLSISEIALLRHTARERIQRVAREDGLEISAPKPSPAPRPRRGKTVSGNDEAITRKILALVDGERGLSEIARLAGCHKDAVRLRRDRLGLDIPAAKRKTAA
ncbi:hypothetical protein [Oceanicola sp. S124]|uniref:hypothetical protein n=1 Tax=Oceanicola sp. S124 TaxID=1042378 RepID=UPI00025585BC|nr:hypothetical protein [Oceanicola sp. S124]